MLCHLLTKLELTASASMAQRPTDDCVCQWVKIETNSLGEKIGKKTGKEKERIAGKGKREKHRKGKRDEEI